MSTKLQKEARSSSKPAADLNPSTPNQDSPKDTATSPSSSPLSPPRHHQRTTSATRRVRETHNARSEYSNSEDDGASQRRINQYIIQQEIGRGSFGSVHLATDQYGNEYAVKEFSKHRLRRRAKSNLLRQARQQRQQTDLPGVSEKDRKRASSTITDENAFDLIKEEIAIMKKLNHENLVSLIEVLDDPEEDSLYMVLEMCKKGVVMRVDLEEPVEPYEEENCRYWFRDLILGIEYLHAQGVLHRDIKPDNCLVTEDNTLKLVDFGVSEMFDKGSDMKISKSAGSPAFMAPELCIVQKEGVAGKPADIWSMGVTLFCLRFGRVPFQNTNLLDLYEAIEHEEVQIPDDCKEDLADLFRRLLKKNPEERIKMPEIREHPWVTKNGKDPLLPAEENCASPIDEPTEEEKNTAITGNMGKLMAVLKAANKFKKQLEKKHPELMESILGRASKMVQPPLTMSGTMSGLSAAGSDIKGSIKRHLSGQDDHPPAVHSSGIFRASDLSKEESHITEKLKSTDLKRSQTYSEPSHAHERESESGRNEPSSPTRLGKKDRRATDRPSYDSETKGHAHDILKDHIFVDIGSGPCEIDEVSDEDELPPAEHHHDYLVSESPTQTDDQVFAKAYKKEVDDIEASGRGNTIYRTRRVDEEEREGGSGWEKLKRGAVSGKAREFAASSAGTEEKGKGKGKGKGKEKEEGEGEGPRDTYMGMLGSAVGMAMQAGGEKLQAKSERK